jgi:hypothetical protein
MSATEPAPSPPRRPRWLQFSLRSLLVVILVAALGLAWYTPEMRRQRQQRREERIEKAIELLAAAPSIYSRDYDNYDPVALVRAVNWLHSLGKEDAIVAIRRFEHRYRSQSERDSPRFDSTLVVPLLFDPQNPQEKYGVTQELSIIRTVCLSVQSDIPFGPNGDPGPSLSYDAERSAHINWAGERAQLRAKPLRPTDDPFQAVDQAVETLNARLKCTHQYDNGRLRQQGLRCVAHLLQSDDKLPDRSAISDAEWSLLHDEYKQLGIRWSEE